MNASKFLRYAAGGGIATALHYAVLLVAVELAGVAPPWGSALGSGCGAGLAYLWNHRFTFASAARHRDALPRFISVALLGAALNAAVVALGSLALGWHYLVAQLLATLLVLLAGYALNRFWTFA